MKGRDLGGDFTPEKVGGEVRVEGVFDDIERVDVDFLESLSKQGAVHVRLRRDASVAQPPRFSEAERAYYLSSLRYVSRVTLVGGGPPVEVTPKVETKSSVAPDRTVLVSGCYDWLHTGHIRFFQQAAALGRLHVTVGSDRSVAAFKGEGHPLHPEADRLYMVGSVRFVHEARVASGDGWLDWAPEAERIQPDLFVVNRDGDRAEKRAFCRAHGIGYRVLQRTPKPGLPRRSSTELRGY